jgi:penicillin-binding protein 2
VKDRSVLRIVVLRVMVVSILLTLLGRLAFLQVAEGAKYRAAASNNRVREVVSPAARGQVLDDRGVALVSNRTALVVSVTRSIVRSQPKHGIAVLNRLAKVIGVPADQISLLITPCGERLKDGTRANKKTGCWNGSPYQPVPVASYASDKPAEVAKVLRIEEHAEDFPGVRAQYQAVRAYPGGSLAAHVLGYLGPLSQDDLKLKQYQGLAPGTLIGKSGVEAVYDDQLRGVDGVQRLLVDKDSTVTGTLGTVPPKSGQNLVLSLDAGIQRAAETALAQGIQAARKRFDRHRGKHFVASKGAAIVIEVGTGRVVAMASYPSYDPTVFVGGISSREYTALLNGAGSPLISNAVQGLYAPGSTFKLVSTAAAVAAGNSINGTYQCPRALKVGNHLFNNFEGEQFGTINFTTTLIKSCDTVYYKLAYDQWIRDGGTKTRKGARQIFSVMARAFGFGKRTGIDLPDEKRGTITDRAYKQRFWEQTKAVKCKRARTGYPEVAKNDPTRAAYLLALAKEFCTDGYRYNAGDAALFAIGQGDVLVSPLQLVMAYSALANGGTLFEPRLAKAFLAADGSTTTLLPPARRSRLPVSPSVLAYIRNALAGVPRPGGTAQSAFANFDFSRVAVGGKTGTADVQGKAPTSWFASFAPVSAPRYAMVVMVPEAGTGGTVAAPISRKIYEAMYGLNGKKALLNPDGSLPRTLPVVLPDGTIGKPGTVVPHRAVVVSSPSAQALGGVLGLLWADVPRRRRS